MATACSVYVHVTSTAEVQHVRLSTRTLCLLELQDWAW